MGWKKKDEQSRFRNSACFVLQLQQMLPATFCHATATYLKTLKRLCTLKQQRQQQLQLQFQWQLASHAEFISNTSNYCCSNHNIVVDVAAVGVAEAAAAVASAIVAAAAAVDAES